MNGPAVTPGETYGRLTVLAEDVTSVRGRGGKRCWLCLCECGGTIVVQQSNLRGGRTRSCGCLRRQATAEYNRRTKRTHGMRETPTYSSWQSMLSRCYNPNATGFKHWGGRGITVTPAWHQFEAFLEDMGERPEGTTLDRIDVNGNYEPGNVRWATPGEQVRNRRAS